MGGRADSFARRGGPGKLGDTGGAGPRRSRRRCKAGQPGGPHDWTGFLVLLRNGPGAPACPTRFRFRVARSGRISGSRGRVSDAMRIAPFLAGFRNRSTSAALAVAAAVMLVLANLFPVLATETSGSNRTDTCLLYTTP